LILNRIKRSETLIQEYGKSGWLVGFMARTNGEGQKTSVSGSAEIPNVTADYVHNGPLGTWDYFGNLPVELEQLQARILVKEIYAGIFYRTRYVEYDLTNDAISRGTYPIGNATETGLESVNNVTADEYIPIWGMGFGTYGNQLLQQYKQNEVSYDYSTVQNMVGKILQTSNGLYRITGITSESIQTMGFRDKWISVTKGSYQDTYLKSILEYVKTEKPSIEIEGEPKYYEDGTSPLGWRYGTFFYATRRTFARLTFQKVEPATVTYSIPSTRYTTEDSPFDLFCIPYGGDSTKIYKNVQNTNNLVCEPTSDIALLVASDMLEKNPGIVLDIQVLPYCPVREIVPNRALYHYTYDESDSKLYSMILDNNQSPVSMIFFARRSNFSFSKYLSLATVNSPLSRKRTAIYTQYRLCAPNYSGVFEFSAAANNGIKGINIDCTYKPYSSYIHVNPVFDGMYGGNFNDQRGLIVTGDLSLSSVTDAWSNYMIQNKNFEQIFARQISSMDRQHTLQMLQGALSVGMSAYAGNYAGAVGGAAGMLFGDARYAENRSLSVDLRNMQIGNVQALPDSVSKVSAISYNNKIWPFIEEYECTDEEIDAAMRMIAARGISIDRFGVLRDYLYVNSLTPNRWIQASPVRIRGTNEDAHVLAEIASELEKGVYIGDGWEE